MNFLPESVRRLDFQNPKLDSANKDEHLHEFAGLSIHEKTREVKRDGRRLN